MRERGGSETTMLHTQSSQTCSIVRSCLFGRDVASWEYSVCSSLPKASTLSIATGLWSKSTGSGDHTMSISCGCYTGKHELETDLLLHHLLWAHPLPWSYPPLALHSPQPEAQGTNANGSCQYPLPPPVLTAHKLHPCNVRVSAAC